MSSINISIEEDRLKEEHIQTEHSQKIIGLEPNSLIYQEVIEDVLDNTNVSIETIEDQDTIDKTGDDKIDMSKTTNSDFVDSFDEITDTDSGIYSLYDTVMISRNMELDPDHEHQERNSPILELDKKFLTDAFFEARSLKKLMDNLHEKSYQKHGQDTIHNIRVRQDALKKLLINLELEKVENNESINGLKHKFFQQQQVTTTSHVFLKKFQSLLDQIDQITNLIFGIEMKIEKCSYNDFNVIDSEQWTSRLTEALALKAKHTESLVRLIKTNLSSENQFELQEKINIKQRQICQLKLIKAEIYCNEMQLKILFL